MLRNSAPTPRAEQLARTNKCEGPSQRSPKDGSGSREDSDLRGCRCAWRSPRHTSLRSTHSQPHRVMAGAAGATGFVFLKSRGPAIRFTAPVLSCKSAGLVRTKLVSASDFLYPGAARK